MAASGTIIKAFLASVGFKADEKSLKSALARVTAFGVSVKLVTAGIYAGMIRAASGEAELARQAERLGTSTKKLKELEYIAKGSNVEFEKVSAALDSIAAKNPRIKDAAQALELVGSRMRGMSEAQQKMYTQRLGIDRSLIPMLTSDVSKLRREFEEMYQVAGVDSKKAARSSKELNAELGKLGFLGKSLGLSVALPFIAKLKESLAELRKTVMENYARIRQALESAVSLVLRISSVISAAVSRVIGILVRLADWFDTLDAGQKKVVVGLGALLAAWKFLNLGFLASPLGIIITLLGGLLLLIEDYMTWAEGGKSIVDWSEWAEDIELILSALKTLAMFVINVLGSVFDVAGDVIGELAEHALEFINLLRLVGRYFIALFSGDFETAAELGKQILLGLGRFILNTFLRIGKIIGSIFSNLWKAIKKTFPDFGGWAERQAQNIRNFFSRVINWISQKISDFVNWLPDWAKELLGINRIRVLFGSEDKPKPEGGGGDRPQPGGHTPASEEDLRAVREQALALQYQMARMAAPALAPAPATAASISNSVNNRNVTIKADTQINVQSSDPVTAGNQAAAQQDRVNAELVRNTRANVR